MPIYKHLLLEATFDVDEDVDYIYDKMFATMVEKLQAMLKSGEMYDPREDTSRVMSIQSNELPSKVSQQANAKNPITIYSKYGDGNMYMPDEAWINLSMNDRAIGLYFHAKNESHTNNVLSTVEDLLPTRQYRSWLNEFTSTKIKSSIYHELSHWLDDTLHNGHLRKLLNRANDADDVDYGRYIISHGHSNVNMTSFEIDATIHGLKQIKRDVPDDVWDRLSIDDLFVFAISAKVINNKLTGSDNVYWKRKILSRMSREGLLGDNMR